MNRIAVVDDEKNIRELIRMALERENYVVDEYANGEAAWAAFELAYPDCIVLDIMMPRMDGMELCRRIRSRGVATPIIFLSSRDEEIDRVLGLESGGDDYVCKPFGMRELLARIRAALRHALPRDGGPGPKPVSGAEYSLERGPLRMDEERDMVEWKGRDVVLTVTEFRMLHALAAQPGVVKTREQLMRQAFPEDGYPNDRAADSHLKRLRRKLGATDPDFAALETIYGLGYRFRLPG